MRRSVANELRNTTFILIVLMFLNCFAGGYFVSAAAVSGDWFRCLSLALFNFGAAFYLYRVPGIDRDFSDAGMRDLRQIADVYVPCSCGCHRWYNSENFPDADGLSPSCRTNETMKELQRVLDERLTERDK